MDDRSLIDRSRAAAEAGDFKCAAELNCLPIQHRGKAITRCSEGMNRTRFAIPGCGAHSALSKAINGARASGILASAPREAKDSVALSSLCASPRTSCVKARARLAISAPRVIRVQTARREVPSAPALHLARRVRLLRAIGNGAEVLSAEAEMIEACLDTLNEIASVAMKDLGAVPGVQIDSALPAAIACAAERRIERHVATQGYFESAERLVAAILECADASKAPLE